MHRGLAADPLEAVLAREGEAEVVAVDRRERVLHRLVDDHAVGAREVGDPGGQVDGGAVPIAAASQGLAARGTRLQRWDLAFPGGVDETDHRVEQRLRLAGREHRGVADHLHEPHGRPGGFGGELEEPPGELADLLDLEHLPESREADEVGEGDRHLVGEKPLRQLRLGDDRLPDRLAQVDPVRVQERLAEQR
jgi:hypothetical protein